MLLVVATFVVADEADVHGGEEREDEGLDETHEDFEETSDGWDDVRGDATERVDQVLAAEDVTIETERKGDEAEGDGDDFDATDAEEDEAEHDPHREAELLLVGLVAEEVEDQHLEARVAQHEIGPGDERDDRQREGGVEVGGRRADCVEPVALRVVLDRADSGEQAAPVHQKDEDEETAEGREYLADHALADDRLEGVTQAGSHVFHQRLALARDDFRGADEDTDSNDDHGREDPGGQDRVRDRNGDREAGKVSGLRIHALRVRQGEGWN